MAFSSSDESPISPQNPNISSSPAKLPLCVFSVYMISLCLKFTVTRLHRRILRERNISLWNLYGGEVWATFGLIYLKSLESIWSLGSPSWRLDYLLFRSRRAEVFTTPEIWTLQPGKLKFLPPTARAKMASVLVLIPDFGCGLGEDRNWMSIVDHVRIHHSSPITYPIHTCCLLCNNNNSPLVGEPFKD